MSSILKLQALTTVSDEFSQKLSKGPYVPRTCDNLVAMGEAQVGFFVRYMENVRYHRRWDVQAEIASGPINLV